MELPDYWLPRPELELSTHTRAGFDRLYDRFRAEPGNTRIEYTLAAPRWQFLCYLADQYGVVMHGTGDASIQEFEPRPAIDLGDFGAQTAVFAAGDGLWAMFYAVLDRSSFAMATSNACVSLVDQAGHASGPFYVFAISQDVLRRKPWRNGTVYLLPGETFVNQPPLPFGEYEVRIPQLASLVPVKPFARLEVTPADFPFLGDIRGLDNERFSEYGVAMQTGAPWPG